MQVGIIQVAVSSSFSTQSAALAQGVGTTNRRTMTIVGTAYSPWLFWDGRKDSQWAQALGPLAEQTKRK